MNDPETMAVIWAVAAAVFIIAELVSVSFVAIYFGVGALVSAGVAWFGASFTWQLVAFSATGIVLMVLTRPFLKKSLESETVPTNVDRMVGRGGIVTIRIDNDANTGQIRVGTEYWTARLVEELATSTVSVDSRVTIESIEGVTARVRPLEREPSA